MEISEIQEQITDNTAYLAKLCNSERRYLGKMRELHKKMHVLNVENKRLQIELDIIAGSVVCSQCSRLNREQLTCDDCSSKEALFKKLQLNSHQCLNLEKLAVEE
jgi:hypothetical protein